MTTSLATFLTLTSDYQHACRTEDWHTIGALLAEDVTLRCSPLDMPAGGTYEGREAALFFLLMREHLMVRPLGSWELAAIDAPTTHGDTTRCFAVARLGGSDLPALRLIFDLRITSEEGSVLLLVEDWAAESCAAVRSHLSTHAAERGVRTDVIDLFASDELALITRAMERTERRVYSRNQIPTVKGASDLGEPIEVQCSCSWAAPGLPPLSLQYALRYRFGRGTELEVQELWEPAEREQLDAYLRAHAAALHERAAKHPDAPGR